MDMQLFIKSLVAGIFVASIIYVANKYGGFYGGILNAIPLLVSLSYLGVYATNGDIQNFNKGVVISNISYVLFTLVLCVVYQKTNKPILSLLIALVAFVPCFLITKHYFSQ